MSRKKTSSKQREATQDSTAMPGWAWGVGVLLLISLAFLGYEMVQVQNKVFLSGTQLDKARKAADAANSAKTQAEQSAADLRKAKEAATKEVGALTEKLAGSESMVSQLKSELSNLKELASKASAELESMKATANAGQNTLRKELVATKDKLKAALADSDQMKKSVVDLQKMVDQLKAQASNAGQQQ